MDQLGPAWSEGIAYTIDLEIMAVVYEGGFTVPIIAMIDRFDDETDDADEAVGLLVELPPDGLCFIIDLEELKQTSCLIPERKH